MGMWLSFLIVCSLFAFGDILGVATKAKLSAVFVALGLFLVLFVTKALPPDIIATANMTEIARFSSMFLIFNMGSSINLIQMRKEWKIVIMSIIAMLVAMASVFLVSPLVGLQSAIVSIPIVNGGIIATQIMTEAALIQGFTLAAALGTIIFAVQKFVGTIPASRFGLKEARILSEEYRKNLANGVDLNEAVEKSAKDETTNKVKKQSFCEKYEKYYTVYSVLGITSLTFYVAFLIGRITGISSSIWCLVLGMLLNQFGLIPARILDNHKITGIFMMGSFCSLIPSLAQISIVDLSALAFQTFVVFAAVLVGTFLLLYLLPIWKIIGSRNLTMGIAMSQLLGFPATFLIVNEVATAVSDTSGEKEYIVTKLTPAFVVSGFVSVTSISILIAGVFSTFL